MDEKMRRKRIARIKKMIIYGKLIIILVPIALCLILFIKLGYVENRLDDLLKQLENKGYSVSNEKKSDNDEVDKNKDLDNSEGKKVYLTFDDGPSESTDEILDILAKYNVKATFFVVGKTGQADLARYRRIVDEGHTLGMHSYSHNYEELYSSVDKFSSDILKLRQVLNDTTGQDTLYFRFPGGSSSTVKKGASINDFIKYLSDNGYVYFDWNVSSGDASTVEVSSETIVENVISQVQEVDTPVVLMHDSVNKKTTVNALPVIIEKLLDLGYEICSIDSSTKPVQHITLENG